MKLHLVLLLALVALTLSQIDEWTKFKTKYGKKYKNAAEDAYRMSIYMENKRKIIELNNQNTPHTMGINKYSDLLYEEFTNSSLGLKTLRRARRGQTRTFVSPLGRVPIYVDWRTQGAVTPVKDQKLCGCCWSFSAAGGLEGQHFRKTGVLVSLSEQNLVDCSSDYGNMGCEGGLMDNAFEYAMDYGVNDDITYPFQGIDGPCRFDSLNARVKNTGYVDITSGSEAELQQAVATVGPISVGVDASGWQFYKGGVFSSPSCSPTDLNHGVLLVGYGTDVNGVDYWIVKNSWGTSWGINGYIHLARNKNNMCGVATLASYPLV